MSIGEYIIFENKPAPWSKIGQYSNLLSFAITAILFKCRSSFRTNASISKSTRGWNIELTFDGVHFTEMGHHMFAKCLFDSSLLF